MTFSSRRFSRRSALGIFSSSAVILVVAACGGTPATPTAAPANPTTAPASSKPASAPTAAPTVAPTTAPTSAPTVQATTAPATGATPMAKLNATVRLQGYISNDAQPAMNQLFDQFKSESGVTIKWDPITGSDATTRTVAAMAAGTAADIIGNWGPQFALFIQKGGFLPLDSYMQRDYTKAQIDDWYPGALKSWNIKGKQWGLPMYTGTYALYYDKQMYDAAGLASPHRDNYTYDDLLADAQKLTKLGAGNRPIQFGIEPLLDSPAGSSIEFQLSCAVWAWGGQVHDPNDDTVCLLGEEPAMEALQFMADRVWKYHVAPTQADTGAIAGANAAFGTVFNAGKAGVRTDGSWAIPGFLTNIGKRFTFMSYMEPIGKSGKRATFLTTDAWGLYKGSKAPDAAWEAIKLIAGPTFQEKVLFIDARQPSFKSLTPKWVDTVRTRMTNVNPDLASLDLNLFAQSFDFAQPMVRFHNHPLAMEILKPALDQIYLTGKVRQVKDIMPETAKKVTAALQADMKQNG
jgi:multiple sugar transport system substrate-binding protein